MSLGKFLLGAVVGASVGAAVGLLLAPRSGVETREMIKDDLGRRYNEKADALKEKADELKARASSLSDTISEKVKTLSEELEAAGRKTVDKLKQPRHPEVEEALS